MELLSTVSLLVGVALLLVLCVLPTVLLIRTRLQRLKLLVVAREELVRARRSAEIGWEEADNWRRRGRVAESRLASTEAQLAEALAQRSPPAIEPALISLCLALRSARLDAQAAAIQATATQPGEPRRKLRRRRSD